MEPWVAEYIGIPYIEHGRDKSGCDCWGLVRLVLAERFGKDLPDLGTEYGEVDACLTRQLIDSTRPTVDARRVENPESGDLVVIRVLGIPSHIGVIVGPSLMLHVRRGTDSLVARLTDAGIVNRIEGVYRVL